MSLYDQIGTAKAAAAKAVADALGETISFSHRGAAAVTLSAQVGPEKIDSVEEGGILTQTRIRTFRVPVQTNFSVTTDDTEPVAPGDTLTWDSKVYSVMSDGIVKERGDRIYVLTCIQRKRLASGVS